MREIVFILESDTGRVTVESSQADAKIAKEINKDLGTASVVNCARPRSDVQKFSTDINSGKSQNKSPGDSIYLYRIYHYSTVDGPGRRSVVQVAGCSIRCAGCYVPETHNISNGQAVLIDDIIRELDAHREDHDGITVLGGEPFDQPESLQILVEKLKARDYHLVIYSGYTLENLLARKLKSVHRILSHTDLLIDGSFQREQSANAGEYRGSRNQKLIFYPISRQKNERQPTSSDSEKLRL